MSITSTLPVGQPLYSASFGQSVKRFFRGYVRFSGRASRSEFWWAMLFTSILGLVVQIPFWVIWSMVMVRSASATGTISSSAIDQELLGYSGLMLLVIVIMAIASLAIVLPTYAVMWRRLQDANLHGAFMLLSLGGLGVVPLVMCALPTNPAGVRFDPAHTGQAAGYGLPHPPSLAHGRSTASPIPQPYGGLSYGGAPYGQQGEHDPRQQQ